MSISRRGFLTSGTLVGGAWSLGNAPVFRAARAADQPAEYSNVFPKQDPKLIEEVVGASHGRFERVKELVTAYPELAKAAWDWGFGDWETPIDAASHVGHREIAMFLMDHGARPTLFTFAMLGELEVVKSMLTAAPPLRKTTGPHGLTLLHHASVGGEKAAAVLAYLKEIGVEDPQPGSISQETIDAVLGTYKATEQDPVQFEILTTKMGLAIKGQGGIARNLKPLADGSFHPAGAASVRLRFEISGGRAASASLDVGGRVIKAARVG